MNPAPGRRAPLSEEVTSWLRKAIVCGEWEVNERIPSEFELMERLSVSRGTLREAIKALTHIGLLEVRRGDGTYVRATSEIHGAARQAYREHKDEDVLQLRFALDTQAARLAAANADEGLLSELGELLAVRRQAWSNNDIDQWIEADWEFHLKVAEASGNSLLYELYGSFGDVFHGTKMEQRLRSGFDGCLQAGHEELVAAIANRDAEAASATVNRNLNYCLAWTSDAADEQ